MNLFMRTTSIVLATLVMVQTLSVSNLLPLSQKHVFAEDTSEVVSNQRTVCDDVYEPVISKRIMDKTYTTEVDNVSIDSSTQTIQGDSAETTDVTSAVYNNIAMLPGQIQLAPPTAIIGDVDGKGSVNAIDFAFFRSYMLGMINDFPAEDDMWVADVDGKGSVNAIDFAYMRSYLLGIISKFPKEKSIDDHYGELKYSTQLVEGQETIGDLESADDVDCFEFNASLSGEYEIRTLGLTDTYGYLYDSSETELASSDNSDIDTNFSINYTLVEGEKYYVKVKHANSGTGQYSILVRANQKKFVSAPTNLTKSLLSGTAVSLSWNAPQDTLGIKGYEIYTGDTLLKFVTDTTAICTGLSCNTDYVMTVKAVDINNNRSANSDSVSFTTGSDDYGNSERYALPVQVGIENAVNGAIETEGDVDCFKFIPPSDGTYRVELIDEYENEHKIIENLYYNSGLLSITRFRGLLQGDGSCSYTLAEMYSSNTYYINVRDLSYDENYEVATGSYRLVITRLLPDLCVRKILPVSTTKDKAEKLKVVVANIGKDETWYDTSFRVVLSVDGREEKYWTDTYSERVKQSNPYYDDEKDLVLDIVGGTNGDTLLLSELGKYNITATIEEEKGSMEEVNKKNNTKVFSFYVEDHCNTIEDATPVDIKAENITGTIDYEEDSDFFKFQVAQTGYYIREYPVNSKISSSVYNSDGKALSSEKSYRDVNGVNLYKYNFQSGKDYYIEIESYSFDNAAIDYGCKIYKAKPDLRIDSISPTQNYHGNSVLLKAVIVNDGHDYIPEGNGFRVGFQVDGLNTVYTDYYKNTVERGAKTEVSIMVATDLINQLGNHKIEAFIENTENTEESNKDNNRLVKDIFTDDYGNVLEDATPVDIKTENITGTIDYEEDSDFLKFKVEQTGYYILEYPVNNKISTSLYNSDGKALSSEKLYRNVNGANLYKYNFEAGQDYYIKIYSYSFDNAAIDYGCKIYKAKPDLRIDSISPTQNYHGNSVLLKAVIVNDGHDYIPEGNGFRVGFQVDGLNTVYTDYYKKTVERGAKTEVSIIAATDLINQFGNHKIEAFIENDENAEESNKDNNRLVKDVFTDDYADIKDGAKEISVSENVYGSILYSKDVDMFNFTPKSQGYYKIVVSGGTDIANGGYIRLVLRDSNLNSISYNTVKISQTATVFSQLLESGKTYYISLDGNTGSYNFKIDGAKPDLKITAVNPASIVPGEEAKFDVTVSNSGEANFGTSKFRIRITSGEGKELYLSDEYSTSIERNTSKVISVNAGKSIFKELGKYPIVFEVDFGNNVDEVDETNNTFNKEIEANYPDLRITGIEPTNIYVGKEAKFIVSVYNCGKAYVNSGFRVGIKVNSDKVNLWTADYSKPIAPGETVKMEVIGGDNGSAYVFDTIGTYTISAVLDDKEVLLESNEENNKFDRQIVVGYTDLVIKNIGPLYVNQDNPAKFNVEVQNIGTLPVKSGEKFRVGLIINGETAVWSDFYDGGIVANGTKTIALNLGGIDGNGKILFKEIGKQAITAIVDDTGLIEERDENNSFPMVIDVLEKADLKILDITYSHSEIKEGEKVLFRATVKNCGLGKIPAKLIKVNLSINDSKTVISTNTNNEDLNPGEIVTLTAVTKWSAVLGEHELTAIADEGNIIIETDETNNIYSEKVIVEKKPDLIVTDISYLPEVPKIGDKVVFKATIKNIGEGASPADRIHRVGFKVDNSETLFWSDRFRWAIQPGESVVVEASWGISRKEWLAVEGKHTITAEVNDTRLMEEIDYTNNSYNEVLDINNYRMLSLKDDYDNDGIDNETEIDLCTNIMSNDTDGDGISDIEEIEILSNPLLPDTDNDGIFDGNERKLGMDLLKPDDNLFASRFTSTPDETVTVSVYGDLNVQAAPLKAIITDNLFFSSLKGIVSKPVEISLGGCKMDSADITFKYSLDQLKGLDELKLKVYWVDIDNNRLVPVDSVVNLIDKTVSCNVKHFSTYILGGEDINTELANTDIVFSVDQSGSMSSSDQGYLRLNSVARFVADMDTLRFRVGIVEYSDNAKVRQNITDNKTSLYDAIDDMYFTSDSTNIGASLSEADSLFTNADNKNQVIILLSDGMNNLGYTNNQVINLSEKIHAKGVDIYTIALGSDSDVNLMQSIASVGGGNYFYVKSASEIESVYQQILHMLDPGRFSSDSYGSCPLGCVFMYDTLGMQHTVELGDVSAYLSNGWTFSPQNCCTPTILVKDVGLKSITYTVTNAQYMVLKVKSDMAKGNPSDYYLYEYYILEDGDYEVKPLFPDTLYKAALLDGTTEMDVVYRRTLVEFDSSNQVMFAKYNLEKLGYTGLRDSDGQITTSEPNSYVDAINDFIRVSGVQFERLEQAYVYLAMAAQEISKHTGIYLSDDKTTLVNEYGEELYTTNLAALTKYGAPMKVEYHLTLFRSDIRWLLYPGLLDECVLMPRDSWYGSFEEMEDYVGKEIELTSEDIIKLIDVSMDLFGFVPVIGDAVDGVHAVMYAFRGEAIEALLCAGAIVPVLGSPICKGGKYSFKMAPKIASKLDNSKCFVKILKGSADVYDTVVEKLVKNYEEIYEIVQETKLLKNGKEIWFKMRDGAEFVVEKAQLKASLIARKMGDKFEKILGFCIRGCFTGETLVQTKNGLKRIDSIQEGEYVLAKDVKTGEVGYKKVLYVYIKNSNELITINAEGEEIRTTASHLFFTNSGWWQAAENIKVGDRIVTANGELKTVIATGVELLEEPERIYNLNVDEFHTYFVGTNGLLVHNNCTERMTEFINKVWKAADDDFRNMLKAANGHAYDDHIGRTLDEIREIADSQGKLCSTFTDEATALKAIKESLQENARKVTEWLDNGAKGQLELIGNHGYDLGFGVLPSSITRIKPMVNTKMYLIKDSTQVSGFRINTVFPFKE